VLLISGTGLFSGKERTLIMGISLFLPQRKSYIKVGGLPLGKQVHWQVIKL